MIYLFIAGSYTPWLSLCTLPHDGFAYHLRWGIWPLSLLGIVYQQLFHEKYKWLETTFYLVIGIVPGALAVLEMVSLSVKLINTILIIDQMTKLHMEKQLLSKVQIVGELRFKSNMCEIGF